MKDMVQVKRPSRNRFAEEPQARIGRSQFDRSHGLKTTFDASYLIPILVDEVMPGDTFTCKLNGFVRIFSPLDAPVMDNIELETFFFFCPTRIIWPNWENFNGAHDDAGFQDVNYTIPVIATAHTVNHDGAAGHYSLLMAYMGLPHALATGSMPNVNSLPFRMYEKVYNEWFRDQNLIDEETANGPYDDGPDNVGPILKSAKRHDYFTSCLPYLQKGTAVSVPLAGTAEVLGIGMADQTPSVSGPSTVYESDGTSTSYADAWTSTEIYVDETVAADGYPHIYANLQSATGMTINALRESLAIQRLLEKDARGGTRYVEHIKSHFGVTSPDFRLQRTEFLGGGKAYVNVSPVANTSDTAGAEQAELSGIGTGVIRGHGWAKSFTEHGYILGLIRARADLTYFQGLDKLWSRSTRYDFYVPALANLGEQSVLNQEIFISNSSGTDLAVFGYQERWSEYRFKKSMLTATFNPEITGSLSHWHLAEDFATIPSLNQVFIEDATPMTRVVSITTEHDFLLDLWFDYKCARPMPVHSIPSIIGTHF